MSATNDLTLGMGQWSADTFVVLLQSRANALGAAVTTSDIESLLGSGMLDLTNEYGAKSLSIELAGRLSEARSLASGVERSPGQSGAAATLNAAYSEAQQGARALDALASYHDAVTEGMRRMEQAGRPLSGTVIDAVLSQPSRIQAARDGLDALRNTYATAAARLQSLNPGEQVNDAPGGSSPAPATSPPAGTQVRSSKKGVGALLGGLALVMLLGGKR